MLEILIVLVILSVMASMLTVSLGENPIDELEREAQRLQAVMQMAADEALLEGAEYALAPSTDRKQPGYRIVRLTYELDDDDKGLSLADSSKAKWQPIEKAPFDFYPLPEPYSFDLELLDGVTNNSAFNSQEARQRLQKLGDKSGLQAWRPEVLILSSGEVTPFEITFYHSDLPQQVRVFNEGLADIALELNTP